MKYLVFFYLLFSTATLSAKDNSDTLTVRTSISCDHCLECGSCAGNINMSLRSTSGIKKVTVIPEQQQIVVVYNPQKTTPEQIRQLINNAGYDADGQKASAEAFERLDGCCKP